LADLQGIMLRQSEFTKAANEVSIRYDHFLETLLASYNRAILSADLSPRAIQTFKAESANVLKHYLEREVTETVTLYNSVIAMVNEDTAELPVHVTEEADWLEHLTENTHFLYEAIKLQAAKDVLYINNFLRGKALALHSLNDGQIAYSLIYNHKDLNFYYTDKLGRKINSTKYIRTLTRDYMVKNYNDLIAGAGILNGIHDAIIDNTDETHKDNSKVIAINDPNKVNYFSIRDEVFHPNSNSILRVNADVYS
jgi:hypothetical protein